MTENTPEEISPIEFLDGWHLRPYLQRNVEDSLTMNSRVKAKLKGTPFKVRFIHNLDYKLFYDL